MVHQLKKKITKAPKGIHKAKVGKFEFWLTTVPNAYGFGRDYTLIIQDTKSGVVRRFWMGQDAKVFSRVLGIRMEDAVDYYSEKAKSKEFDKVQKYIAEDILKAVAYNDVDVPLKEKDVEKMFKEAEDWSFAVQ